MPFKAPDALIDMTDWRAVRKAQRDLRRNRPWMWGKLRHLWCYNIVMVEWPWSTGLTYHWKTRADRELEFALSHCCKPTLRCEFHRRDYV
jgi:hypothetical protein